MTLRIPIIALSMALAASCSAHTTSQPQKPHSKPEPVDSAEIVARELAEFNTLTEEDYEEVARELGIEVAAIKAVVEIEAGRAHQGFWSPGKPLINFDLTMFRKFAARRGVTLGKYAGSHAPVFSRPNSRRYGSQQAGQQARLDLARTINKDAAVEGTFWGMFQIGGFNWKLCGCESLEDFEMKMSRSERDQLELFAKMIQNTGMVKYLQAKNWAAFAQRYNGPSYRARGYHTKMAAAYARHKKTDSSKTPSNKKC